MRRLTLLTTAASAILLAACETAGTAADLDEAVAEAPPAETAETETAPEAVADTAETEAKPAMTSAEKLSAILAAQPDDVRARYDARNPAETLTFFGIEPGMTVAEALPGRGWYTKILLPYIGPEGEVVGAQYPSEIWPMFGMDEENTQARVEAANNWTTTVSEWGIDGAAPVSSYEMTRASGDMAASLDAVLFIRALHNLNRFNPDTGWFDETLAETYTLLKPGGVVGVVQHRSPEANADDWADGSSGYVKETLIVEAFETAGFVLEAKSETNANPKDVPTEEDFVWRLPPSLGNTEEGTPDRAAFEAIGESDRMTLLFRKPV
ncbi:MAG: methyltransferase [Pseudomonadota bacterium]